MPYEWFITGLHIQTIICLSIFVSLCGDSQFAVNITLEFFSKYLIVISFLFCLQNTALLARRLLNGELEPAKILNMSPTELKVKNLLCYIMAAKFSPLFVFSLLSSISLA